MTTPDPARQAAYEAGRRAFLGAAGDKVRASNVDLVVDAVWSLAYEAGVEEGRRQSRALDPEVAEVVADTTERFEGRNR